MADTPVNPGSGLERIGPSLKANVEKMMAATSMARVEQHPQWPLLSRIPLLLQIAVPVLHFKVGSLLALAPGQVLRCSWAISEDMPLVIGDVRLGWGEFEVVEQRLAIRLTRVG